MGHAIGRYCWHGVVDGRGGNGWSSVGDSRGSMDSVDSRRGVSNPGDSWGGVNSGHCGSSVGDPGSVGNGWGSVDCVDRGSSVGHPSHSWGSVDSGHSWSGVGDSGDCWRSVRNGWRSIGNRWGSIGNGWGSVDGGDSGSSVGNPSNGRGSVNSMDSGDSGSSVGNPSNGWGSVGNPGDCWSRIGCHCRGGVHGGHGWRGVYCSDSWGSVQSSYCGRSVNRSCNSTDSGCNGVSSSRSVSISVA
ncbi:hypothetical protein MRX96_009160 [Rhipicephalus microplus]